MVRELRAVSRASRSAPRAAVRRFGGQFREALAVARSGRARARPPLAAMPAPALPFWMRDRSGGRGRGRGRGPAPPPGPPGEGGGADAIALRGVLPRAGPGAPVRAQARGAPLPGGDVPRPRHPDGNPRGRLVRPAPPRRGDLRRALPTLRVLPRDARGRHPPLPRARRRRRPERRRRILRRRRVGHPARPPRVLRRRGNLPAPRRTPTASPPPPPPPWSDGPRRTAAATPASRSRSASSPTRSAPTPPARRRGDAEKNAERAAPPTRGSPRGGGRWRRRRSRVSKGTRG